MKKIAVIPLRILFVCLSVISCNKSDSVSSANKLVGTWISQSVYTDLKINGIMVDSVTHTSNAINIHQYNTYKSDGTFSTIVLAQGNDTTDQATGKYFIEGDSLTIINDSTSLHAAGATGTMFYSVLNNTLTLKSSNSVTSAGDTHTVDEIYVFIKQ